MGAGPIAAITQWHLYIIRCGDGSLYTGVATDIERRLAEHREGRGAKYLRGRQPLRLVFQQPIGERSLALRIEHRIKRLSRSRKQALIRGQETLASLMREQDLPSDHDPDKPPPRKYAT